MVGGLISLSNGGVHTGSFTINLYADSSTSPGAFLATFGTFNDDVFGTATGFDLFGAPRRENSALAASTRYWIGLLGRRSKQHRLVPRAPRKRDGRRRRILG